MQNAPTPSNQYANYLNAGSPAFSPPAVGASPSVFNRPSPAPTKPTMAYTPSSTAPQQGSGPLRTARAPSLASQQSKTGAQLVDLQLETRKAFALLMGTGDKAGTGGLLDKLEQEFDSVMRQYEQAYDDNEGEDGSVQDRSSQPTVESLLATMNSVVMTLQSSALGGFPVPTPQNENQTLQQRIDTASSTVQKLFKERQRAKEGADIAANILNSA
ncbi:hypothetical protein OIO90_004542 [Microbotryomycetes sp. JL221]|nr:hypothetical protein OIO90_004542 [Microbotryomycetes sp. JL221]